jgi:hypothetical protein
MSASITIERRAHIDHIDAADRFAAIVGLRAGRFLRTILPDGSETELGEIIRGAARRTHRMEARFPLSIRSLHHLHAVPELLLVRRLRRGFEKENPGPEPG